MSKLTQKQETFCLEYLKDGNATRAYKIAYNCSKTKESSINVNASKLLKDTKIIQRLDSLKEKIVNKALWKKEDSILKLKEALSISKKANEIVMVVKELNAMHGYNAPIKSETEITGNTPLFQINLNRN